MIDLCRYCGGESIKIPTLDQLKSSIEALQLFYDVEIMKKKTIDCVPQELIEKYNKIVEVYSKE